MQYNVAWVEAYFRIKWHLDASKRLATIEMGRQLGELCPLFWAGELAWTKAHLHAKCHLDPSSRLATIDMGRKWGAPPLFGEGEVGSHLTQCRLGRGVPPCQAHLDPCSRLATIDMGRKLGELCSLLGRGLGPHRTQSRLG